MAHTLHVVLTTTELDDANLVVAALRNDFGHYFSASNNWSTDGDFFTVGDQQNAIEGHGFASGDFQFFDLEEFTFSDFVLLAAGNDYCIRHGISPIILLTQRFI
ncbi:hypothetical protein D3C75_680760 [compost metagenome]